jgi:phytoene dehydrogenase-like protein
LPNIDVAVVGAGHNALIAAAYLARAGHRVAVFERAERPGGAVQTRDDIFPGCRIDVGSSAHILIHLTPILQELELERYGLRYVDCDPWAFYPLEDGRSIFFHKDVELTCRSIAAISPADAAAYPRFLDEWRPISKAVLKAFLDVPSPARIGWTMATGGGFARRGADGPAMLQTILGSYRQLIDRTFTHPAVRAAIEWIAAQSGPPPMELGSAPLAGWQPLYHESGVKRAVGGSGALTTALVAMIRDHGGEVHTSSPVRRIVVEGGRAVGVDVADGAEMGTPLGAPTPAGPTRRVRARAVVAGCHVATTFGRLLADAPEAAALRERVKDLRVGNGFGMILRCVTSELPAYAGWAGDPARGGDGSPGPMHLGLQLLCPPAPFLDAAYSDFLRGDPARDPPVVAMTWSAVDPSLAPPGKHLLFAWAQWHPYALSGGRSWADERERAAADILRAVGRFAPNVPRCVEQVYIQTPLDLEEELALFNGNVMHLEMSLDQMFMFRPAAGLAAYRTPIRGLYLTGASTHPGGGVFGASGRNAARVVLRAGIRD